jgi:hypothetical protein
VKRRPDPLHGQPLILKRADGWPPAAQAAILWEALVCAQRNNRIAQLRYEAARRSLEAAASRPEPPCDAPVEPQEAA